MILDDLIPGYADLTLKETGLTYGGQLSINSGDNSKFDISAGGGVVADHYTDSANPKVTDVVWDVKTAVTVTNIVFTDRTYIALDLNGDIVQQENPWTPEQRRDYILLGLLVHPNNTILQATIPLPKTTFDITQQLVDFIQSIGPFNISGNVISPNGANLNIDRSAGSQYRLGSNYDTNLKNPSITSSTVDTPLTFRYRYQDGLGGFVEGSDITLIDVINYDNSGSITLVPSSNKWQIQKVWVFASGATRLMYGQNIYKSMADALAALMGEDFNADPNLLSNAALRGWIIVSKDTVDLSDDSQAKFIEANSFGDSATGGASSSTTTLQGAYINSVDPEITTNSTQGGLTLQGGTGTDTDSNLEIKNNAGAISAKIQADGDSLFNNISLTGGLKDTNVLTAVNLGSATDTTLNTTKKDILGGINELESNKVNVADIKDDVVSTDSDKPLSARMGAYLDTVKQPLNSDLTSIAGLSPLSNDVLVMSALGWVNKTLAEFKTLLGFSGIVGFKDEDNMASNSDVDFATQQSIKAYVDSQSGSDTLSGLTDTNITGLADNNILQYDSVSSKWVNGVVNDAFNKAFGATSGSVCEGNDVRLSDSRQCNNSFDNADTAKTNLGLGNVDNTSDAFKNSADVTLLNKNISGSNNTITNINADNISTGTLSNDRLPTTVEISNLGIGVSPNEEIHVYGATPSILIENTSETDTTIRLRDAQATVGTQDLDLTYNCSSGDFSVKQDTQEVMNIDAAGAVTLPKQPAAHRTLGSTQSSVTGDGTEYTLQFPTEIYDQSGNLSSTTWTASKTGKHYISGSIALRDVKSSGANFVRLKVKTSIRTYTLKLDNNADVIMDGITTVPFNLIGFEMDEDDTLKVTVQVSNGNKTVDIYTSSNNYVNLFIGILH